MEEMDEVVAEFLVESYENLDRLDRDLVGLEQNPSADKLAGIFRTIHTIKGTSGFLGYGKLESITHVGENLLCRLRGGGRAGLGRARPAEPVLQRGGRAGGRDRLVVPGRTARGAQPSCGTGARRRD